MSHQHVRVECSACGKVIRQCRCFKPGPTSYELCSICSQSKHVMPSADDYPERILPEIPWCPGPFGGFEARVLGVRYCLYQMGEPSWTGQIEDAFTGNNCPTSSGLPTREEAVAWLRDQFFMRRDEMCRLSGTVASDGGGSHG